MSSPSIPAPKPKPKPRPKSTTKTLYFAYGSNLSLEQMSQRCPLSQLHYPPLAILPGYRWVICPRGYANIVKIHEYSTHNPSSSSMASHEMRHETISAETELGIGEDLVYGLLYDLDPHDEAKLDIAEGVPWAYEKSVVNVHLVPPSTPNPTPPGNTPPPPKASPTYSGSPTYGSSPASASPMAISAPLPSSSPHSNPTMLGIHTAAQIGSLPTVPALVYIDPDDGTGICIDEYRFRMNRGLRDAIMLGMPREWVRRVVGDFVPLLGDLRS